MSEQQYNFPMPDDGEWYIDLSEFKMAEGVSFKDAAVIVGERINQTMRAKRELDTKDGGNSAEREALEQQRAELTRQFSRLVVTLRAIPSNASLNILCQLLPRTTADTTNLVAESMAFCAETLIEYRKVVQDTQID